MERLWISVTIGTAIFYRLCLSRCCVPQQPAGGNSVSGPFLVSCLMEGGVKRQCPLIGDYGSVDESRGGGGRDKDKEKEEKGGEGWGGVGWGGLLTLPPGVLSRCQEADRFLLSGHESACSVLSCQSLLIYQQHTSIQSMSKRSSLRAGVKSTKILQEMLCDINILQTF